MIDVIHRIVYSNVGSGDFVEVTVDSIENDAILLGNLSIHGDKRTVVYAGDVDALIKALQLLKENYL